MGGRGSYGDRSNSNTQTAKVEPYDINKVDEEYVDLRKFTGTIDDEDLRDYGEKFGLPTGEVKMVKIGEWMSGNGPVGSYVFADGSHTNLQFIRDTKRKKFYIETID